MSCGVLRGGGIKSGDHHIFSAGWLGGNCGGRKKKRMSIMCSVKGTVICGQLSNDDVDSSGV